MSHSKQNRRQQNKQEDIQKQYDDAIKSYLKLNRELFLRI